MHTDISNLALLSTVPAMHGTPTTREHGKEQGEEGGGDMEMGELTLWILVSDER